jgi:hypothetical protein
MRKPRLKRHTPRFRRLRERGKPSTDAVARDRVGLCAPANPVSGPILAGQSTKAPLPKPIRKNLALATDQGCGGPPTVKKTSAPFAAKVVSKG